MVVFPEETKFYTKWQHELEARGVKVRLSTEVDAVVERGSKGVKVLTRPRRPQEDNHNPKGADQDLPQTLEEYDEIVLCVLADTAERLLGKTTRWIDRQVLGSTKWADDITVTHTVSIKLVCWPKAGHLPEPPPFSQDTEYMEKWYTCHFDDKRAVSTIAGRDDSDRVERGKKDFNPMYLIKNVPQDPKLLEMCFDCSNFQYQLKEAKMPFEQHVFQTIFLNKKNKETWSYDEIKKDKIIREDWWHQLMHEWTQ